MNVLFVTNILTPYQIDLAVELNKYCDYKIYYVNKRETNRDWIIDLKINNLKDKFIYCDSKDSFRSLLKKESFPIIIIGGYSHIFSKEALIYSREKSVPTMGWLELPNRNFPSALKLKLLFLRIKNVLNHYNAIVAIGGEAQQFYKKVFVKKNFVFNIPYAINVRRFLTIERKKKNKITFLFVGQLIKRKNVKTLLKAFARLKEKYPQAKLELAICGIGSLENLVKKYSKYRVKYFGFVQPTDLPKLYEYGDILILPSLDDGWGVVVNEAMASAMPVIGSKYVGAVKEYILSYKNGFVVNTDVNSIYNAMKFYIENPDEVLIQGERNRKIILKSNGNVELAAKSFWDIFNLLLTGDN